MQVFYDYIDLLEPHLRKSLTYYTTPEYKEFNNKIRNNILMSREHNDHYNNILDIFDCGPVVKTNITLYRGMTKRYKIFDNESFISTSTNKEVAKTFGKGSKQLTTYYHTLPNHLNLVKKNEFNLKI